MQKGIENMMQVGFGFGTLLEPFLFDFGFKLGAKLDQVGTKIQKKNTKNNIQIFTKFFDHFLSILRPETLQQSSQDASKID